MADATKDKEDVLLFLLLARRWRRHKRAACRTAWSKTWLQRRHDQGAYANLFKELNAEEPDMFRRHHRLDRESFQSVLAMVEPLIRKRDIDMRPTISPGERLSATLRFLATGESFRSLSFQYRMGERTISNIVNVTCQALFKAMKEQYLKVPASTDHWKEIAEEFKMKWNYPFCIGALDGKHIAIQQPAKSGSEYFNYKHFFSILLLALVDANYSFLYIDVGATGRVGDAGVFADSSLKKALDENILNLPEAGSIEGIPDAKVNYHIIGDAAFPMSVKLIKSYPHRNLDQPMKVFDYRLSRARRVVENAIGLVANRFRVFFTTINLGPDKVQNIILAACCLHNFMVKHNKHTYTNAHDVEDIDNHNVNAGQWRSDPALTGLNTSLHRNPTKNAKEQRQQLKRLFYVRLDLCHGKTL